MSLRALVVAFQLLTRLPTPRLAEALPDDLARAGRWFALVGAVVGALVAAALWLGALRDPWLGALAALLAWTWVTGALHLDGLADLADGLGAAHGNRERLLAVMKDPHKGTFGVVALFVALAAKLVLLALTATELRRASSPWPTLLALALVPAWARLGSVVWAATLPPLSSGSGARFAARLHFPSLLLSLAALGAASAWARPGLLCAPLLALGYRAWLRRTVGGMTGDCLGAGIEITEIALLLIGVLAPPR